MRSLILALALGATLLGCDTASTVEDPTSQHFIKFYGRDGDQTGCDLVVLPDGSMILFGTSRPTAPTLATQWYLARVDPKGVIVWESEFGGLNNEEARDIELTSANQLVLVGNTYGNTFQSTDRDVMIMTVGLDGIKIDSATIPVRDIFGVPITGTDEDAAAVTETTDGFIISGSTTYVYAKAAVAGLADTRDALKIRVYSNLSIYPNTWIQTYGYFSDDASTKIVEATAGTFHVFGYTNNLPSGQTVPNYNYWAYILGANGDPTTQQVYPGTSSGNERLSSFCFSPIGYFLGGLAQSGSGPADLFISEVNIPDALLGFSVVYEKSLSIALGTNPSGVTSVFPSQNGGFFVLGNENGFNSNQNWVLTKVNLDGSLAWSTPIVYGGEGLDECGAVQELPDGRIILIGTMRTGRPDAGEFKLTLIKVNSEGKFEN